MEGTALSERDLQRSRAESASAVFLLADRFSPNYQQEDLNVQFQVCVSSFFMSLDVCTMSQPLQLLTWQSQHAASGVQCQCLES